MNTHDHDDNALPGEDELKALYRSLPSHEPSRALDETVKHAARAAAPPRRHVPRWPVAAASAAVLVVAVGLGWRMQQQPTPAARSAPAQAITLAPSTSTSTSSVATNAAPAMDELVVAQTHAPVTTPESPKPRESLRAALKPRVQEPALAAKSTAPAEVAEAPVAQEVAAPPQAAPVLAPAPMQPAPAADVSNYAGARSAMTMKTMAGPAARMTAPTDATAIDPRDTPTQELDKIRQLLVQQRRDEALQRLAAFRQAHPDIAVPDDLRQQLPDHE